MAEKLYGGIEGGGTKFICVAGTGPEDIRAETRIETGAPEETMRQVIDFFKRQPPIAALGFSCFGPLDPDPASPSYGRVLATPKPHWSNADVVGMARAELDVPIAFDTDVNGAALGEWNWGAARGLSTFVYLTIGTGIGGGAFVEGKLLHGLIHPEMGHIPLPHDREKDPFGGVCPFHSDCFEGLACGPALEKRWGARAETLPPQHPAWELETEYISSALAAYVFTLSPQRIILGGGIGQVAHLLPRVQEKTRAKINGYVQSPDVAEKIESYIVHPGLGNKAGALGAIALAKQAFQAQAG